MSVSGWCRPAHAARAGLRALTALLLATSAAGCIHELGHLAVPGDVEPFGVIAAVVFTTLGAIVVPRQTGNAVGWLFLAIGAAAALASAAGCWSDVSVVAWLAQWTPWLAYGLLPLPLMLFPDGRLPTPGWRWLLVVTTAGLVVTGAALAVAALDAPTTLLAKVDT